MNEQARQVRHLLFQFYLKECRPPTIMELANQSGLKHNGRSPTPIAMAHPFSHLPTPFVVKQGNRSWWANCICCAFGLASMLAPLKTTVMTRSGSIGVELNFTIEDDKVTCTQNNEEIDLCDCHAHFSIPPAKWWKDIRFACGTVQVFGSKDEALEWPKNYGFYSGDTMTVETLWRLSKAWYHNKHTYEYDRKSAAEAGELFNKLGLMADFWQSQP